MSEHDQHSARDTRSVGSPRSRRNGDSGDYPDPGLATINVREMLSILRRRSWIVLAAAALCVGAAAYRVQTQEPLYQATAVIRLVDTRRILTGGLVDTKSTEVATQQAVDPLRSQVQVLLSRAVSGIVVDSSAPIGLRAHAQGFPDTVLLELRLLPDAAVDSVQFRFGTDEYVARLWSAEQADTMPRNFGYGGVADLGGVRFRIQRRPEAEAGSLVVMSRDEAIDLLLGNLTAQPRVDTDVIDVHYTASNPLVAQSIANTVVRVFQYYNIETAFQQARRRRTFVEEQLQQNDSLLTEAEALLNATMASREQATSGNEITAGEQAALTALEIRREELNAELLVYRSLLADLQDPRPRERTDALRAVASSPTAGAPVIAQLYQQMVAFQTTRDSLTTGPWRAGSAHPEVQRLNARISGIESDIVNAVRSFIASLETRIVTMDQLKDRNQPRLATAPATEEERQVQQVASLRRSADLLREELQEARIAAAAEVGQVEIVDAATIPSEPIGMGKLRTLALGLLLGLVLGSGTAFGVDFVDQLNTRVRRRSELEIALALPALAVIPPIPGVRRNGHTRWRGKRKPPGPGEAKQPDPSLVMISDFESAGAEAYRVLRTNLLFSQAVAPVKTLIVTSAVPAEGKTTTSANLAVTFAQQGLRVLLVDCDLRRPRVHEVFDCERSPGLTQVLLDPGALDSAIRTGPVPGVFILPAGARPPNPSELLGSAPMRELVEKLASRFDFLLLDSPPVLAASDAAVLSTIADGVLLVLRAGRTDRQEAQNAVQQLEAVGARVIGAVLNDPDTKVPGRETTYYGYYAVKE